VGRAGSGPARPGYDPGDMGKRIGMIVCAVFGAAAVGATAQETGGPASKPAAVGATAQEAAGAASKPTAGAGTASKPASGPASRRARPEWKASLSLPVDLWVDATAETIGETGDWTNKAEIGDVDGDGRPDLLFANGGDYDKAGAKVQSRVFLNRGRGAKFEDATKAIFGETTTFARAIKVRDVSGDGIADVFVANTYGLRCRLYLGLGGGKFKDATETHLPNVPGDFGDVECGDADGDGDLDLALAAWGDGSPMKNDGGRTALWLNDGAGKFVDATAERMPDVKVKFCWELEWVDVDGDFDLDLLVSAKRSKGSFLFENDGTGRFKDVSAGRLPQFTNNYEFEAMDVDGDGIMDLVTINDGTTPRFSEHLFRGDGKGGFVDCDGRRVADGGQPELRRQHDRLPRLRLGRRRRLPHRVARRPRPPARQRRQGALRRGGAGVPRRSDARDARPRRRRLGRRRPPRRRSRAGREPAGDGREGLLRQVDRAGHGGSDRRRRCARRRPPPRARASTSACASTTARRRSCRTTSAKSSSWSSAAARRRASRSSGTARRFGARRCRAARQAP
jgi:hypothetical protein